jgi:hypothetical protein
MCASDLYGEGERCASDSYGGKMCASDLHGEGGAGRAAAHRLELLHRLRVRHHLVLQRLRARPAAG